ncbi:hypothetical protein [Hoylesella nanceiensis]
MTIFVAVYFYVDNIQSIRCRVWKRSFGFYGIREWVESLPKRKISLMILQNYIIIGL